MHSTVLKLANIARDTRTQTKLSKFSQSGDSKGSNSWKVTSKWPFLCCRNWFLKIQINLWHLLASAVFPEGGGQILQKVLYTVYGPNGLLSLSMGKGVICSPKGPGTSSSLAICVHCKWHKWSFEPIHEVGGGICCPKRSWDIPEPQNGHPPHSY